MQHRLCFLSRNYRSTDSSGNKAKTDNEDTLTAMGAVNVGLRRTGYRSKILTFLLDLAGVLKACLSMRRGDRLLLQYPVKKYFAFLCWAAHLHGAKVIALIHDLGSFRRKKLTVAKEISRLSHADYIIASNSVMQDWLVANGLQRPTGALGLFDFRSPATPAAPSAHARHRLVYAGALNLRKNAFILQLPKDIAGFEFHVYGNCDGLPGLQESALITFHDFLPADRLIREVDADFGFVWDGDSTDSCTGAFGEYLRWNSPHKVSFYLRAGLPVIIWRGAALSALIEEEKAGLCVDSIAGLSQLLPQVSDADMAEMKANARRLGQRLQAGDYLRTAVGKAVDTLDKPE